MPDRVRHIRKWLALRLRKIHTRTVRVRPPGSRSYASLPPDQAAAAEVVDGVPKDADITVVLYTKRTVKSNYAFRKGELNADAIAKIVADIPKILPAKK